MGGTLTSLNIRISIKDLLVCLVLVYYSGNVIHERFL